MHKKHSGRAPAHDESFRKPGIRRSIVHQALGIVQERIDIAAEGQPQYNTDGLRTASFRRIY